MKKKEIIPGEWEIDRNGRRFRRVGTTVEYAPTILTASGGEVYADDLEAHNRRMQQQTEQRIKRQQEAAAAAHTGRKCPFKLAKGGISVSCKKDCALYGNDSCSFANMSKPATRETKDQYCPIVGQACLTTCAVYNKGCSLIFRA